MLSSGTRHKRRAPCLKRKLQMALERLFRKADLSEVAYDRTAGGLIARRDLIRQTLRLAYQSELRAVLYAFGNESLLITATSLIAEAGSPQLLSVSSSDEQIGNAILDKLLECCAVPFEAVKDRKPSEWPSYVLSGAKTIQFFEANSIRISVETANSAIRLEAKPTLTLQNVFVGASHSIAVPPEELGASVRNLIGVVRCLRASDAI